MKANFSIDVNVKVDLTENSINALKAVLCGFVSPVPVKAQVTEEKPAVEEKAPEAPKAVKAPAEKKPAKPVEEPKAAEAPAAPAESQSCGPKIDIEDVRKALAEKVNEHRDAIKQKLTELGAPNVTKLDPAKYAEMYDFLKAL